MLKSRVSDSFYQIGLLPDDVLKLDIIFPVEYGNELLIYTPLKLPMG